MKPIRNSAKAVIVRDDRLLVLEKTDAEGTWYVLPGGGQKPGETLEATLTRECAEEIAVEPEIGDLLWIREYIGANHEFAAKDRERHQVSLMFRCHVPDSYKPAPGHKPDSGQRAVRWLDLHDLMSHRLYPLSLRPALMRLVKTPEVAGPRDGGGALGPVYLGDVN